MLRSNLQLQSLCLDDNQLVEIGDALASLAQLETLKLEKNRPTTVRASSFTACARLTLVRLSNNGIATIERGAFASATKMDKPFLRNNEIATLHSGMFTCLCNLKKSLRLLDLAHNEVAKVDAGTLDALVHLDEPDLLTIRSPRSKTAPSRRWLHCKPSASMTIASPSSFLRWSWAWALPWRAST